MHLPWAAVAALGLLLALAGEGCRTRPVADLAIAHAAVFDSRTGEVIPDRTVVIDDGRIQAILEGSAQVPARTRLDAAGRLLTPGLVDVHHHLAFALGDSITPTGGIVADLDMAPDSLAAYRKQFALAYLPYGVTTVRSAGDDETYEALLTSWMKPVPWAPDFYPCGGALVSEEPGRTLYAGHAVVHDPEDARARVRHYHDLGYRFVKLYWRLREPEFRAALDEALRLGMSPFAHIDFGVMHIDRALDLGVRDFEHVYTLIKDVMTPEQDDFVWNQRTQILTGGDRHAIFFVDTMEKMIFVGPHHPGVIALIHRLAAEGASVTPTLVVFARPYGLTSLPRAPAGIFDDTRGFNATLMEHGRQGLAVMKEVTLRLYDAGVRLNLGTDSADPGRAALAEMQLLHQAGIPMAAVLTIATANSAATLGLDGEIGRVAPGYRADLVLFDENPLQDPAHLTDGMTVIKDGAVWTPESMPE